MKHFLDLSSREERPEAGFACNVGENFTSAAPGPVRKPDKKYFLKEGAQLIKSDLILNICRYISIYEIFLSKNEFKCGKMH